MEPPLTTHSWKAALATKIRALVRSPSIVPLALFVTSLFFNGFFFGAGWVPMRAWGILLLGWLSLFAAPWGLPALAMWLANPLFIVAWVYSVTGNRKGLLFAVPALICALSFLFLGSLHLDTEQPIAGRGLGYYLWLSSMILLVVVQLRSIDVPIEDLSVDRTDIALGVAATAGGALAYLALSYPAESSYARLLNSSWEDACSQAESVTLPLPANINAVVFSDYHGAAVGDAGFGGVPPIDVMARSLVNGPGIASVSFTNLRGEKVVVGDGQSPSRSLVVTDRTTKPLGDIIIYSLTAVDESGTEYARYTLAYLQSLYLGPRPCLPDGDTEFDSTAHIAELFSRPPG